MFIPKTPDEIKKSFRLHTLSNRSGCIGCAYRDPNKISFKCQSELFKDVREYIKQLESQNAELLKKVEQLEAERDAAVADISRGCYTCRNGGKDIWEEPCDSCRRTGGNIDHWQWRGAQKEK